jgi:HSP20 family protein
MFPEREFIVSTLLEKPEVRKELTRYNEPFALRDPLKMFDWMREEMDRLLDTVPFSRLFPTPRLETAWMPVIEVFEKNDNLFVRVDLPGLKKEDVAIEVTTEGITIKGERKLEFKEEKKDEGYFRTERVYGEFSRFIPLPELALTDKINATFAEGVLEIITPLAKAEKLVPKKVVID